MSTHEPGTVAVATVRGVPNVRVMRRKFFRLTNDGWHMDWSHTAVKGFTCTNDEEVTDVRPLVVLDLAPGDLRCVVENLRARATYMDGIGAPNTKALLCNAADQIEQQTRPPKPAEPKGLGAVVEDARGDFWVYTGLRNAKDGETRLWFHGSLSADYADVAAVRVLSEGVQP